MVKAAVNVCECLPMLNQHPDSILLAHSCDEDATSTVWRIRRRRSR